MSRTSSTFWRPQFAPDGKSAAAPAYERLLAQCWDDLHRVRPTVNVIAATAPRGNDDPASARPSESPVRFYQELARAYRKSGCDRPIFDTVGHNFQTRVEPAVAGDYTGRENDASVLDALPSRARGAAARARRVDQSTQLADAVRLAYCQPYVGAFFNFLLADQRDLSGWQSGVLWRTGSRSRRIGRSSMRSPTCAAAGSTAPRDGGVG